MGFCVTLLFLLATATIAVHAKPPAWSTYQQAEKAAQEITQSLANVKNLIFPRHCGDLLKVGQKASGVYTLFHKAAGSSGQKVYCDMETDGGGWTVVVRRGQFGNGVFYFHRDWDEYATGFGDPAKEYWIGNRALHELTSGAENMTLRVILSNTTEDGLSINYESIQVDSEAEKFALHIGRFLGPQGWDSLSNSDGMMFSTYDQDNDGATSTDCAAKYQGGWWYNNCFKANLNGLNLNGNYEGDIGSIDWVNHGNLTVYTYSYPNAIMLIRPTPLL